MSAAAPTAAAEKNTDGLFDAKDFDDPELRIETAEGDHVDEIVVKVTGSFKLPRKSTAACQLFRALQLGRPTAVTLTGQVSGEATKTKVTEEKGTTIVMDRAIRGSRIDTIRVAGEEHNLGSPA